MAWEVFVKDLIWQARVQPELLCLKPVFPDTIILIAPLPGIVHDILSA